MLPAVESGPAGSVTVVAHISGRVRIAAPVERVFDTAADSRNEPSFNPAMSEVELLTPPPIGLGAQFRARMGKAGTVMLVELTEFDRPHRLGSRTTSSMMETTGALTFTARNHTDHELGLAGAPEGVAPDARPACLAPRRIWRSESGRTWIWSGADRSENDGGARCSPQPGIRRTASVAQPQP